MGIRDFIENLERHRDLIGRSDLSEEERREALQEAEMMVGMAEAAIKALDSTIENRRLNLNEEHSVRFAQDIFVYLRDLEEDLKGSLQNGSTR